MRIWTIAIVMMVCSWLSYVDSQILAVLSPTILSDTGMSAQSYATVLSAFSLAYMIANPLWGSLLDYFGLRLGMLVAVGVWTVASASHAVMEGFLGFVVVRTVLGIGEGATFPGGFRAALDSLPAEKQSRGIAISYSGGSLGAIVTPLIVVPIADAYGWQSAFLVTGALGVVWLAVWWFTARPPYLPPPTRKPEKISWPNVFERRFWLVVFAYAVGAFPLGLILYLAPLYLNRALGVSQTDLGKLLWVPPLGWEVGYFVWGAISDRNPWMTDRPLSTYAALSVVGLPLAGATMIASPVAAVVLFFWSMFVASGFVVVALRAGAKTYAEHQASMVAGIAAGSWSALNAILLPMLGRWFDEKLYATTFLMVALAPVAGTLAWWMIHRPSAEAGALKLRQ